MKHRNNGARAFLPNSCSLRTANIISVVERCGYIHENNLKSIVSLKEIYKLLFYIYESKGKQE